MMNGLIALLGSGEYLEVVDPIDEYLLQGLNLNGRKARVVCMPTAAGREGEGSINRWSRMGIEHFERLGAEPAAPPIIDHESANDPRYESQLESADIIYFSGGDPVYLYQTLDGSRAWAAAQKAWERGAIYAGCSAGAMILARNMPNLRMAGTNTVSGFGVLPACYIFPHYDAMPVIFKPMIMVLRRGLKSGEYVLGIDENTALVGKREGEWRVIGAGKVHVIFNRRETTFEDGEIVALQPPA
jgi:cyanophycinase